MQDLPGRPARRDDGFPFDCVVFDLDGTLVDSVTDIAAAVDAVLGADGLAPLDPALHPQLLGEGAKIRIRTAFELAGAPLDQAALETRTEDFRREYAARMLDHSAPYPGAAEALARLAARGVTLAVCTNKDEAAARRVLAGLGLAEHIRDVAGPDTFGVQKPHPGHVAGLLGRMGMAGRPAVLVGDTVHDILAAHRAGLAAAHVSWGYGAPGSGEAAPDFRLERFADLEAVLSGPPDAS